MQELFNFVAGCAIGGLLSWLITHRYYVIAGKEQKIELERLAEELRRRNTLDDFKILLDASWRKTHVDNTELWVCEADNTYQIRVGNDGRDFKEPWVEVHPDPVGVAYPVYLEIGSAVIQELTFVSVDGGRIFVPMPKRRSPSGYVWSVSSLEVKVCRIIGTYYRYDDLEGVAAVSKVEIAP